MPRSFPPEVRRQVIELARADTKVKQLARTFGVSEASIYNWLKQDRIDRGEVDEFRDHYNEHRPHRALTRTTPGHAYRATPKAAPASNGHSPGHYLLRYDRLDHAGKMTLRRAGRLHHLAIGTEHARKRVLAFADDTQVTVTDLTTGEALSTHQIDPNRNYWRNQNKEPGRWPSSPN
jgi:transposase-like protein